MGKLHHHSLLKDKLCNHVVTGRICDYTIRDLEQHIDKHALHHFDMACPTYHIKIMKTQQTWTMTEDNIS